MAVGSEEILTEDGFPKDNRGGGMCAAVAPNDMGREVWMRFATAAMSDIPSSKEKVQLGFSSLMARSICSEHP